MPFGLASSGCDQRDARNSGAAGAIEYASHVLKIQCWRALHEEHSRRSGYEDTPEAAFQIGELDWL